MRPILGDEGWPTPRRATNRSSVGNATNQMSFFLADEATVDAHIQQQPSIGHPHRHLKKVSEPGFVFPSLRKEDAGEQRRADRKGAETPPSPSPSPSPSRSYERDYSPLSSSPFSAPSFVTHSPSSVRSLNQTSLSRPMTPFMLEPSNSVSSLGSPSSRRESFSGSISENAISFDGDGSITASAYLRSGMMDSGGAPQLIMPSIQMPRRRPFTETGKNLGRLKLLLAGDTGVGKTSLIKAICQSCEHIVHVDPIAPSSIDSRRHSSVTQIYHGRSSNEKPTNSTSSVVEIFASTKQYPEWWDLDESRVHQGLRNLGGVVLDRNICFVDTSGYRTSSSVLEAIMPCVDYVESHLSRALSDDMTETEILNVLGGSGGSQVDAVLYLVKKSLNPPDIEFLHRLASLTNVIPVLAQTDKLTQDQLVRYKEKIADQLYFAGIQTFSFNIMSSRTYSNNPALPYAVSSKPGLDHDVMDASLLMSSEYVQPLAPTELAALVGRLFSADGSAWLRHSAAKKYIEWRKSPANTSRPKHLFEPLQDNTEVSIGLNSVSGVLTRSHRPSEDLGAHLHVIGGAFNLQRHLATERERYAMLAHGERAVWLTEILEEHTKSGTLVPVRRTKKYKSTARASEGHRTFTTAGRRNMCWRNNRKTSTLRCHQDPLGILQTVNDIKTKSWIVLKILGHLGIWSGLAWWIMQSRRPQHWPEYRGLLRGCEFE